LAPAAGRSILLGQPAVDRDAAGGEPVDRPLADEAVVARALEGAELVAGLVQGIEDAEAGEAHRLRRHRQVVVPVVEERRREGDGPGAAAVDLGDLDRRGEDEARMEELQLEGQAVLAPPRGAGAEADVAVLVVVEPAQVGRHRAGPRLVGLGGQRPGASRKLLEGEFLGADPGRGGEGQGGQGEAGGGVHRSRK
jgi:hypothetical protein